jgi:hypothetical protein
VSKRNKNKFGLYYKRYYLCGMKTKIKSTFEIVINGVTYPCSSLLEAEKKFKSAIKCESEAYVVRKDYEGKKLLETYFIG